MSFPPSNFSLSFIPPTFNSDTITPGNFPIDNPLSPLKIKNILAIKLNELNKKLDLAQVDSGYLGTMCLVAFVAIVTFGILTFPVSLPLTTFLLTVAGTSLAGGIFCIKK
jgi:hypothetical protein